MAAKKLHIHFPERGVSAEASEGDTLLEVIQAAGLPIEALCAGRGSCGKCAVRANGEECLACRTAAADGMSVEILRDAADQEILTDSGAAGAGEASGKIAIAIDIGTTTVVVKAIDTGSGADVGVRAFTNPQRAYGADVLSRINNAMDDASVLSGLIARALDEAISGIIGGEAAAYAAPEKVVIAGNTTMTYLLLNLPCRSLGLAPFEPAYALKAVYDYSDVFGVGTLLCPVYIYPYISAFVGGDIVSGLVHIERRLETGAAPSYMLVDMGTNGEIAYRNGSRLITTSTAAGPALEGGNLTCGMAGLPGAIYEAGYLGDGRFSYKTIGEKPASGICGSGAIDLMAKLLDAGLISESGAFTDSANAIADGADGSPALKQLVIAGADGEDGDGGGARIVFTQKDVREFQLAKGAIRAGIDILIEEMGEPPETFYLAGGFGQNISLDSAFRVGLLPKSLMGRVRFAGNTSLGGCAYACLTGADSRGTSADGGNANEALPALAAAEDAREINLGAHKSFNNKFMETMMFLD